VQIPNACRCGVQFADDFFELRMHFKLILCGPMGRRCDGPLRRCDGPGPMVPATLGASNFRTAQSHPAPPPRRIAD
jgi:hypothetical protein